MRRIWPAAIPVLLSLAIWSIGSAAVMRHVLLADTFTMREVRTHGQVPKLALTLLSFAIPYLVISVLSWAVASGIARLLATEHSRRRWIGAGLGSLIVVGFLGWSTLYAALERPALFAGFYARSGTWQYLQQALERHISLTMLGLGGLVALCSCVVASFLGLLRDLLPRDQRRVLLAGGIGALALVVVPWATRSSVNGGPNLLLVIVDSLRSDLLEPGSRTSASMPAVSRFATEAIRFRDASTPVARTYPSVTSLLTGRHPLVHGVRTHYPTRAARLLQMPVLPELLRQEKWTTIAVGGYCATVLREMRFDFEQHRTPVVEADIVVTAAALSGHPLLPVWARFPWARRLLPQVRATVEGSHPLDITRDAIAAWRSTDTQFLLTVFYDNAHLPYVPVWPDSTTAMDYAGPNRYNLTALNVEELIRVTETAEVQRKNKAELANARRLYYSALSSVDRAIASLLQALERDGLADDTVVMILGDHGQNLLDHDGPLAHGDAVERDSSNSIPWLVRWPGHLSPQAIDEPVTIMDLFPTVVDLFGLPGEREYDGISLAARMLGGPTLPERPLWFETGTWFVSSDMVAQLDPSGRGLVYPDFDAGLLAIEPGEPPYVVIAPEHRQTVFRAKHRRVDLGPWSLTYMPRQNGAGFRLFHRDTDPMLTRDLAAQEPERLQEMIALFYQLGKDLGDGDLLEPEADS